MSETTDKINKLAKQHEVIGAKTDCKYFSNIGNLCSRVENGMARCDEILECDKKYIDALKEENKALKKRFEELVSDLGWHCVQCTKEAENYKLKIENEKIVQINHELAKEHKTIGQDLYAEIKNYRKEKENLKEENEKQKEQIKQLEDFIKSDGEIDHINHEYTYKLKKVLQEVKSIAKGVRSYLEVLAPRDVRFEMDRILNLITEIELLDQKESEVNKQ